MRAWWLAMVVLVALVALVALVGPAGAQMAKHTPETDLAAARAFARGEGDRLWPGYGAAPFDILLIRADGETLLCRDRAPAGFAPSAPEPATGCNSVIRPRGSLPAGLLAAMPLFGPPATIVMGTPEATGRDPAGWTSTILHEHFHQWEWSRPDHYRRVAALDLANGDETGMWMLNFAFPYADAAAGARYAAASRALADALDRRGNGDFRDAARRYWRAREAFARQVGERNWRYLDLQLWQEGVARWTEIALDRLYPDAAVQAHGRALEQRTLAALRAPDLAKQGRELAYPLGAGEAMLLEVCDPTWRARYPAVLGLTALLGPAIRRCAAPAA